MVKTLDIIFHGEEYVKAEERFSNSIEMLQNKYKDFFIDRPGKFQNQTHDYLINHFITYKNGNQITLTILPNSDLPNEIINDCINEFRKSFGND